MAILEGSEGSWADRCGEELVVAVSANLFGGDVVPNLHGRLSATRRERWGVLAVHEEEVRARTASSQRSGSRCDGPVPGSLHHPVVSWGCLGISDTPVAK
jgi:hypothetical protein